MSYVFRFPFIFKTKNNYIEYVALLLTASICNPHASIVVLTYSNDIIFTSQFRGTVTTPAIHTPHEIRYTPYEILYPYAISYTVMAGMPGWSSLSTSYKLMQTHTNKGEVTEMKFVFADWSNTQNKYTSIISAHFPQMGLF